ncbi:hypothetical protein [Streptomyces sp. NRRL S-495]|uniref:hypothetical protein n=1 Tax=Streptomyces sp. NRRL S-495 TaxID=1609133 RepID=UPI0005F9A661|nr:hypothetical protein [Streptomyces sp. NRRL S-495]KJY32141.1 hypothetical protein VR45_23270 [Streptomyces sp. NRRL S-495]
MAHNHEPEYYTAGEKARAAGLIGLGALTSALGLGTGIADRRIARLQATAVAREDQEAEDRAWAEKQERGRKDAARRAARYPDATKS